MTYDFRNQSSETSFEPIPTGDYKAYVENIRSNPASETITLVWQITEGPYKGQKLFDNYRIGRAAQSEAWFPSNMGRLAAWHELSNIPKDAFADALSLVDLDASVAALSVVKAVYAEMGLRLKQKGDFTNVVNVLPLEKIKPSPANPATTPTTTSNDDAATQSPW